MKKIFIVASLAIGSLAFSQATGKVGVNEAAPQATLDIKPNAANAAVGATTNEGVLVPRLSKERVAAIPLANRVESTLVYVTNEVLETDNATFTGTGKGFYYYDAAAARWVKMGAGAGATTTTGFYQPIRTVTSASGLLPADWTESDYSIVLGTGFNGSAGLPDPTQNANRIVAMRNISGANRNIVPNTPINGAVINTNRGLIFHCDGTNWHVIGGF